jgi:hypothetical protein
MAISNETRIALETLKETCLSDGICMQTAIHATIVELRERHGIEDKQEFSLGELEHILRNLSATDYSRCICQIVNLLGEQKDKDEPEKTVDRFADLEFITDKRLRR